jgi:PST family polysaccharide transporter
VCASAGLLRDLKARDVAMSDLLGNLVGTSLVTIPLAFAGMGFWALVFGSVAQIGTRTALLCLFSRQRIEFKLDPVATVQIWRNSAGYMFNAFLARADGDTPRWIIGHYLARGDLGLFSRANTLTSYPAGLFSSAVDRVIFPGIALVKGQGERLRAVALDGVQLTAVVGLPLTVALVLLGDEVIRVILGHRWEGAIAPFRILCLVTYFRLANRVNWVILRGLGRPNRLAMLQGLSLTLLFAGSIWGARAGLAGVTLAVAIAAAFSFVIMAVSAMVAAGVSLSEWARSQGPGFASALLAVLVLWPASLLLERGGAPPVVVLATCAAMALLTGGVAVWLAPAIFMGSAGARLLSVVGELVSRNDSA